MGFLVADPPPQDGATEFSAEKSHPHFGPPNPTPRGGGDAAYDHTFWGAPLIACPPSEMELAHFCQRRRTRPFGQIEFFRFLTAPETAQAHTGHSLFGHRLGEGGVNQIEDLLARAI